MRRGFSLALAVSLVGCGGPSWPDSNENQPDGSVADANNGDCSLPALIAGDSKVYNCKVEVTNGGQNVAVCDVVGDTGRKVFVVLGDAFAVAVRAGDEVVACRNNGSEIVCEVKGGEAVSGACVRDAVIALVGLVSVDLEGELSDPSVDDEVDDEVDEGDGYSYEGVCAVKVGNRSAVSVVDPVTGFVSVYVCAGPEMVSHYIEVDDQCVDLVHPHGCDDPGVPSEALDCCSGG